MGFMIDLTFIIVKKRVFLPPCVGCCKGDIINLTCFSENVGFPIKWPRIPVGAVSSILSEPGRVSGFSGFWGIFGVLASSCWIWGVLGGPGERAPINLFLRGGGRGSGGSLGGTP